MIIFDFLASTIMLPFNKTIATGCHFPMLDITQSTQVNLCNCSANSVTLFFLSFGHVCHIKPWIGKLVLVEGCLEIAELVRKMSNPLVREMETLEARKGQILGNLT